MNARRFEIVRGDAGYWARYIAANGRQVWRTSELYTRRHNAEKAILSIAGWRRATATKPAAVLIGDTVVEVRHIDARSHIDARTQEE